MLANGMAASAKALQATTANNQLNADAPHNTGRTCVVDAKAEGQQLAQVSVLHALCLGLEGEGTRDAWPGEVMGSIAADSGSFGRDSRVRFATAAAPTPRASACQACMHITASRRSQRGAPAGSPGMLNHRAGSWPACRSSGTPPSGSCGKGMWGVGKVGSGGW